MEIKYYKPTIVNISTKMSEYFKYNSKSFNFLKIIFLKIGYFFLKHTFFRKKIIFLKDTFFRRYFLAVKNHSIASLKSGVK